MNLLTISGYFGGEVPRDWGEKIQNPWFRIRKTKV